MKKAVLPIFFVLLVFSISVVSLIGCNLNGDDNSGTESPVLAVESDLYGTYWGTTDISVSEIYSCFVFDEDVIEFHTDGMSYTFTGDDDTDSYDMEYTYDSDTGIWRFAATAGSMVYFGGYFSVEDGKKCAGIDTANITLVPNIHTLYGKDYDGRYDGGDPAYSYGSYWGKIGDVDCCVTMVKQSLSKVYFTINSNSAVYSGTYSISKYSDVVENEDFNDMVTDDDSDTNNSPLSYTVYSDSAKTTVLCTGIVYVSGTGRSMVLTFADGTESGTLARGDAYNSEYTY